MVTERKRRLPVEGTVNCRDLGGYQSADGRSVRWGRLYRSDSLAELTDPGLELLMELGIKSICDLRDEAERAGKPNRDLSTTPLRAYAIPILPYRSDEIIAGARQGSLSAGEVETRVCEIYRRFVVDHAANFTRFFDLLLEPDALPLLFHCTSGRDRTGFATALILLVLGVPRQTIAEDYALSNLYRRDLTFQMGNSVASDVMAALTQAHPDYLASVFSAIDEGWGSDENYLREALGLTAERQRFLQALLLEPSH